MAVTIHEKRSFVQDTKLLFVFYKPLFTLS